MPYYFNPKYISDQVLNLMQTHGLNWKKPWIEKVGGNLPVNAFTRKPYHGMNVFLLMGSWNSHGRYWATKKQWEKLGIEVPDDQKKKGTALLFFKRRLVTKEEDGEQKQEVQNVITTFLVYSAHQVGWQEPEGPMQKLYDTQGSALVQGIVSSLMVDVRHGGNRAYYSPMGDYVQMPDPDQFKDAVGYDATLLHEVGHWTGHEKRGLRQVPWAWFGTPDYAREELVAELISVFMTCTLGVEMQPRADHAAYLQSWMQAITEDKWEFYRATKKAEAATRWILKQSGLEVEEITDETEEVREVEAA